MWPHAYSGEPGADAWGSIVRQTREHWRGYATQQYRFEYRPMDRRRFAQKITHVTSGRLGPPAPGTKYPAWDAWTRDDLGLGKTTTHAWIAQQSWRYALAVIEAWNHTILFGATTSGHALLYTFQTGA